MYMLIKTTCILALVLSCCLFLLTLFLSIIRANEYGRPFNVLGVGFCTFLIATFALILTVVSDNNPYAVVDFHRDYIYVKNGEEIGVEEFNPGNYMLVVDDDTRTVEIRPYKLFGIGPAIIE